MEYTTRSFLESLGFFFGCMATAVTLFIRKFLQLERSGEICFSLFKGFEEFSAIISSRKLSSPQVNPECVTEEIIKAENDKRQKEEDRKTLELKVEKYSREIKVLHDKIISCERALYFMDLHDEEVADKAPSNTDRNRSQLMLVKSLIKVSDQKKIYPGNKPENDSDLPSSGMETKSNHLPNQTSA